MIAKASNRTESVGNTYRSICQCRWCINLLGYSKLPSDYLRENSHFVTTNKNGEEVVSVACMLLFGKKPQLFFPRARTRFIRYNGVDEKVDTEVLRVLHS